MPVTGRNGSLRRRRMTRGLSLIEVLITLVITSVGLLGLAKMQAAALANTQIARGRSLVALQLESLAAAMHGNRGFWAAGTAPQTFTLAGATVTDSTGALSAAAPDCASVACTPIQMAAYDVQHWAADMAAHFPTYAATVNCSNDISRPIRCSLTASWSEHYLAYNQTTAAQTSAMAATQSLTLHVQP
ncbi:putative type-4 fimbrial biogenesis pilV-related transmembrane protein [Cupriavidus taiwanensis]|uniref:type IV pilus modification protein PilV n=1 Tax=Cupriavidus taiwanensis TaxID=164546 RepID=UPI000E11DD58|nr:type IV pilus modification protein PilV [Cupriavidus taiwanensis]SPA17467.1 putative type-4 fimbrial biogenesis pilV-related transmembrane protein [Cupriavidus taiwanensis]